MTQINYSSQQGFALLITLLTVGVVVSATIAIVELSRMQLQLSVDSRDAEVAFSAANAAKECAQYVRTVHANTLRSGGSITVPCLNANQSVSRMALGVSTSGNGNVWRYQYEITWGDAGSERCSVVNLILAYSGTSNLTIGGSGNNSLQRIVSNYPTNAKVCETGSECTIIAAAGYNARCTAKNNQGVLKREVLLEF